VTEGLGERMNFPRVRPRPFPFLLIKCGNFGKIGSLKICEPITCSKVPHVGDQ
jgi:hypothetical protein